LCVRRDLFLDLWGTLELLFDGSVQPPLVATTNKRGACHFDTIGDFSASNTNLDPAPNTSRPHLEQNGGTSPFLPLTCIEGSGFVPCAWRNWWPLGELLPLCNGLFFPLVPLTQG
jgi:hypothetical protein